MTTPLDASVSLFKGSTDTTPHGTIPLATVLQRIQMGTYRRYVEQLRRTLRTQGEDAYDAEKKRSIAFCPAGTFTQRNSASLDTPSGWPASASVRTPTSSICLSVPAGSA